MPSLDPNPRPLDHLVTFGFTSDTALISRDTSFDYAALDRMVGEMAAALLACGLQLGDRVASWLPKTVVACILPLAAARAGLIYVPINPILKRAQVAHILSDSGARRLITTSERAQTLSKTDVPSDCAIWFENDVKLEMHGAEPLTLSNHDPDQLAAILYTSGSTGRPKGVMLSHANLWLGAISVSHYLRLTRDDKVLCVLPFSFDYGQNQLLSTWAAGGSAVPLDYLLAKDVVRAVQRHAITTLAGIPPLWLQLTEAHWPRETAVLLSRLTNSGGALSPSIVARLKALFSVADLYPMYGLTEAFRSTYLAPDEVMAHPTSMGRAIPFAEIMVIRSDGTVADTDEEGELVHAGPLVAKGYWRDVVRTNQRFRPAPAASTYGGIAVWSGDTVRRDAEGRHYFVGRDDEMIKVSGNRISPSEIEEAALASGVVAAAVAFGMGDDHFGHAITLILLGEVSSESALLVYLRRELPNYMQPSRIVWKDHFPRNPNGKFDRAALKASMQS